MKQSVKLNELPDDALVTICEIVRPPTRNLNRSSIRPILPIARATWYEGIKNGVFPKPIVLPNGQYMWRAGDIKKLINTVLEEI